MKKIAKKLTALLLSVLLFASALPLSVFAADAPKTDKDGSYLLKTAEDLLWFSQEVNSGNDTIDAQLTADIDLTGEEWIPIGGDSGYCGTFNGNGFTVTVDISVDDSYEYGNVGLFGYLYTAVLKNLKVAGTITVENDACQFVGGITGGTCSSQIINCANKANITIETDSAYVGGIAGFDEGSDTKLKECSNHGTINAENSSSVGGIMGCAIAEEVSLEHCYNSGSVSGAGYTGGLVGEGSFRISSCYSSAGLEDWGAPDDLISTGLITGGEPGDIAGIIYDIDLISNSLCHTDIIVGSGNYATTDLESCKRFCDCYSIDDILVMLNYNCDDPVFVIDENGFGDGWPVLAWELKGGSTPDENDQALTESKQQALAEIDRLYSDQQIAQNYDPDDQKTVTDYRDTAIATIEAAKEISIVNAALKALTDNIATVPTASDRLTDYKKTAVAAIEKAYFYQDVGPYSTRDFGYKADLNKIIVNAGQLGLRHDLKDKLLQQLDSDMAILAEKKDAGIQAVNAAVSKAVVDTEKETAITAMAQTVNDAENRTIDSGVTDKWDGTTKIKPSGLGTLSDPYRIGKAAELAWFADAVNSGKTELHALLTADIDLAGNNWTPIALKASDNQSYSGTFDGDGHTVHGLYVNVTKENNGFLGGLFGYIGKKGTVRSLHIAGLIRQELGNEYLRDNDKQKYAIGGIAGRSAGTIYECESSVALTHGKKYSNCNYIGGLVGYQSDGIIEKCTSYAVLFQTGSANFQYCFGGVTGYSENSSLIRYTDSYAAIDLGQNVLGNIGGITGTLCDTAQIRECRNFGTIHFGNGIAGSVLNQAGLAFVQNSGTVDGQNSLNVAPGAAIAGFVNTSGELSWLYNDGKCVYGLINTLVCGTVRNAQSSADVSLFGKVDIQHSVMQHCIRVDKITPKSSTRSNGALGQAKLNAARTLLNKMKTNTNTVYGTQSDLYNAILLDYLRKTELAESESKIKDLLEAVDKELQSVPTQLSVEKKQAIDSFKSYINERVYDETDRQIMEELLSEATKKANAAGTVKALTDVKDNYLGTKNQPGLFETSCDTYNTKTKSELYNTYLYGKTYEKDDLAKLYACYETWGIKIDRATSVDEIDTLFANANKALHDLSADMAETGKQPDMAAVSADALSSAKKAAQSDMIALCADGKAQIEALRMSADGKGYAKGFLNAMQRLNDIYTAQADKLAVLDLQKADSFAAVEDALAAAKLKLTRYTEDTARRMNDMLSLAAKSAANAWDGVTHTEPACIDGVYQIANGAELAWLADFVNSKSSHAVSAKLIADIDLAYQEWTPIGLTPINGNGFYGTLNGNGHKIKGLYISKRNNYGYYGLIGVLRGNAVICDLDIYGTVELDGVTSDEYVGALAASAYNATVQNCRSYAEIRLNKTGSNSNYAAAVGGLIGKAAATFRDSSLTVKDCTFRGLIALTETENNREPNGVGGIIGKIEEASNLINCTNYGTVKTDKALGVGGIVGTISTYNKQNIMLAECSNWGDITNDADNVMDSKGGTGGIAGIITADGVEISECYNTGTISASKLAGGILGGENHSFASGSSTIGSKQLVLKNCYNAGKLLGPNNQSSLKIGSIAGYPLNGEYKEGLYILNGCSQTAFGWISSRGDSVQVVDACDLKSHFADGIKMTESIAGLNGGHPLFLKQLSDSDVREEVACYITDYYDSEIKPFASVKQNKEISDMLNTQTQIIRETTDPNTVIKAYQTAMGNMNKDELLEKAKSDTKKELESKTASYIEKYPEYSDTISALLNTFIQQIDAATNSAQTDTVVDSFDADVVQMLIESIGAIDENTTFEQATAIKQQISVAQSAYDALTDSKKDQVNNFIKLIEAKAALETWEKSYTEDQAAAAAATEQIQAIGTVTLQSKSAIEKAENAYNSLTDRQKAMVSESVYNLLQKAIADYEALEKAELENQAAADKVTEKIRNIGTVSEGSKSAITAARAAYDALTPTQKNLLDPAVIKMLTDAENAYAALINTKNSADSKPAESADKSLSSSVSSQSSYKSPLNADDNEPEIENSDKTENSSAKSTLSTDTKPSNSADSVSPKQHFDIGILWLIGGIILALAIAGLPVYWFIASKRKKHKKV